MTQEVKQQTQKLFVAGSFCNQLMGNNRTEPVVGQGATRMWYTDRSCYEVISVSEDGNTAVLEELDPVADKTKENGMGHQNWILNPTGRFVTVEWRKTRWCIVGTEVVFTKKFKDEAKAKGYNYPGDYLESKPEMFAQVFQDAEIKVVPGVTREKKTYSKVSIIFGRKDYYYDWSF